MKLVDILARELKVWPETTRLAQDSNGHVFGWTGLPNWDGDQWLIDAGASLDKFRPGEMDLADDHMTSSVTRAEWQASVDALKAEKAEEINWPNGATHYEPSRGAGKNPVFYHVLDGKALYAWAVLSSGEHMDCPTNNPYGWDFDYSTAIPRPIESYADRINAPKVVEWDGVGDPPVGTVCEYDARPIGKGDPLFVKVEVKYLSEQSIVIICTDVPDGENKENIGVELALMNGLNMRGKLRPILTAEQVAAEEREKAIKEMIMHGVDAGDSTIEYSCAALYDAGYRKEPKPCGS